jgi:hypothetical protein
MLGLIDSPIAVILVALIVASLVLAYRQSKRVGGKAQAPVAVPADRLKAIQARADRSTTRPASEADKAFARDMLEGMVSQIQHEQGMVAARGQEPLVVRLAPQIPIRADEPAPSWLGGEPAMPPHVAWPEAGGRPAVFLAQICCADLPAGLWDGLGPREGWLAFFLHPEDYRVHVLHLAELGPSRPGPALDDNCGFNPAGGLGGLALPHAAKRAFPRWPVDIVAVRPGEPDPRAGGDAEVLHEQYRKGYDLVSPERYPFDWASALAMLDIAEERVSKMLQSHATFPGTLPAQLDSVRQKLAEAERSPEPRDDLEFLRNKAHDLPILVDESAKAGRMIEAAASQLQAVAAGVRERAARVPFSSDEIASVMQSLRAIEWLKVRRGIDKDRGRGAEGHSGQGAAADRP